MKQKQKKKKINLLIGTLVILSLCSFFIPYALNNNVIPGYTVGYRVYADNEYAYVSHNDGVEIIDIQNNQHPDVVGNVDLSDGTWGIEKDGDLLYLAGASHGLVIANISNPKSPIICSETIFTGATLNIAYQNGFAYLLSSSNILEIINVTDPQSPVRLGTYASPQAIDYRDVIISGDTIFIADGSRGVEIVNVSLPSAPSLIRTLSTSAPIALHKYEDLLFLGCHGVGVKWYDVSDLTSPVLQGTYREPDGEAYGVFGNSTHLYVADLQKGAFCLDITEGHLVSKLFHYSEAAPHDITGWGNNVYLGDQDRRFLAFDDQLTCLYTGHRVGYGVPIALAIISLGFLLYNQFYLKKKPILT